MRREVLTSKWNLGRWVNIEKHKCESCNPAAVSGDHIITLGPLRIEFGWTSTLENTELRYAEN
jgi:hypothetical protein